MKNINRRNFLKNTGAASAAAGLHVATPWITKGLANNSPNERINIAVMGIKSQGFGGHIRSFARMPNVTVSVLCDIDERLFPGTLEKMKEFTDVTPKTETDIRRVIDDKDVDVLSIASPNHWHALAAIWACQAGKDVYVEKPVSHNIFEGRKMVEASVKYNRIVQTGTQHRSKSMVQKAIDFIHSGKLGKIYMAKCVVYRPRTSIGHGEITPVPKGVNYDLFRGPAPMRPFNENRFHYNWHWFWDTGNGESGNNGVHYIDIARWGLNKYDHPVKIQSMGGNFIYDSEQETPNTQTMTLKYADGVIVQLEVRNLHSNADGNIRMGVLFFGSEGYMELNPFHSWATFFGKNHEPGPGMKLNEQPDYFMMKNTGIDPYYRNFIKCVRSRRKEDLNSDILEGHLSTVMCHLGNIAYRTGRTLTFDPKSESFPDDKEARKFITRNYRKPFVVPEKV